MGGGVLPDTAKSRKVLSALLGKKIIDINYSNPGYLIFTLEDGIKISIEATLRSEILQTRVGWPFLRMKIERK